MNTCHIANVFFGGRAAVRKGLERLGWCRVVKTPDTASFFASGANGGASRRRAQSPTARELQANVADAPKS